MKGIFEKIFSTSTFLIIQLICSAVFLYFVKVLDVLPSKYFYLLIAGLLVLLLIPFLIQIKSGSKGVRSYISRFLCVLFSATLIFGGMKVKESNDFLEEVTTQQEYQVQSMYLLVLNDSEYQDIEDLEDKTISYNSEVDSDNISQALEDVKSNLDNANYEETDDFSLLASSLTDGDSDAILINYAYTSFLETENEDFMNQVRYIYSYEIKEEIITEVEETTPTVEEAKADGVYNVFISGIDTYGSINTVSRSDVNMLLTINTNTNQILITSMPRDSYVTLASYGAKDKLTHSGIYGVSETISTVENWLNVDIDYYMRVNFSSVVNIVNAIGGINIYVDQTVTLDGHTYSQGSNYVTGEQALRYARERKSYSSGDNQRIKNQQAVLKGIINKCLSASVITNYSSLLTSLQSSFQTNFPIDELKSIIREQVDEGSSFTMSSYYITGSGTYTTGCYSMPSSNLYVMVPSSSSVSGATAAIKAMY